VNKPCGIHGCGRIAPPDLKVTFTVSGKAHELPVCAVHHEMLSPPGGGSYSVVGCRPTGRRKA
jgi:hypothetical protein